MRRILAHATATGLTLAAFGAAIVLTTGCGDEAIDPLAADVGLSDADTILAAPGFAAAAGEDAVTREVTLTDDGVVITIDSDDADIVAHIQERAAHHAERPQPEDAPAIEAAVENTATGVIITITRATEEAIAHIQERATQEHDDRGPRGRRGPRPDGEGERGEGVERTVTLTDTGVEIRIESDDPETVERIQNRPDDHPRPADAREDITVTVADTENGVLITMTGETAEAIEFLHSRDPEGRPQDGERRDGQCPRSRRR